MGSNVAYLVWFLSWSSEIAKCIKMKHIIFSIICFSFVLFGGQYEAAENYLSLDLLKNEIDDFRRLENLKVNWPKIKNWTPFNRWCACAGIPPKCFQIFVKLLVSRGKPMAKGKSWGLRYNKMPVFLVLWVWLLLVCILYMYCIFSF